MCKVLIFDAIYKSVIKVEFLSSLRTSIISADNVFHKMYLINYFFCLLLLIFNVFNAYNKSINKSVIGNNKKNVELIKKRKIKYYWGIKRCL